MFRLKKKIVKLSRILDLGAEPVTLKWEYILTAFVLSTIFALVASNLISTTQSYTQLVVGSITWRAASKNQDYLLILLSLIGTPAAYTGIHLLSRRLHSHYGGTLEATFQKFCGYALLPLSLWLGGELTGLNTNFGLLLLSLLLTILIVGLSLIAAIRSFKFLSAQDYSEAIGSSLLSFLFSACSGLALVLAVGRFNLAWQLNDIKHVLLVVGVSVLCCLVSLLLIWLSPSLNTLQLNHRLRGMILSVQGFIPLFFLVLIPNPWAIEQDKFYGYSITPQLIILVSAAIAIAYIDWGRRLYLFWKGNSKNSYIALVSPACLVAILLFLKTASTVAPTVSPDDYHYGEFLLPWWLWNKFGYIPFQDYEPARGLVNYVPGFLASIFFNDTAESYTAIFGQAVMVLPFLAVGFLVVSQSIGLLPAFLAFVLMPSASGMFEIYILLTAALCYLCDSFLKRLWSRWLLTWGIIGLSLILFAPGQGALFLLATSPLGAVSLYQAIRYEKLKFLYVFITSFLGMAIIAIATPLDQMLLGAIRYGLEQSSTNSTAYGVEWAVSNGSNQFFGYVLWELVRTSWIFVGIAAALLLYRILPDKTWPNRKRFCTFAVPIVLSAVLWIPRAAGRIDPASFSRLGEASVWFICLLLPIILVSAYRHRQTSLILLIYVFCGGLVVSTPIVEQVIRHPIQTVDVKQQAFTKGLDFGLPNLGSVTIDSNHLNRLQSIKKVLQVVLEPGETYLDLTNRNAHYFYLGYPPPISTGAIYNLVNKNQQIRALKRLEASPPPIVLASAENITHDGGTVALRSHLIYRYVVDHYVPVQIGKLIFMVRPDRLDRLNSGNVEMISDEKASGSYQVFLEHKDGKQAIWEIRNINQLSNNIGEVSSLPSLVFSLDLDNLPLSSLNLPNNLVIKGTGDFDQDGQIDLMIQDQNTQNLEIWLLEGEQLKGTYLLPKLNSGWNVLGIINDPVTTPGEKDFVLTSENNRIHLLDQVFRVENLERIPMSWGQSFSSLESALTFVSQIEADIEPSLRSLESVESSRYHITGSDPSLSFDISSLNLNGWNAGLLVFDWTCDITNPLVPLSVSWSSQSLSGLNEISVVRFLAKDGKLIVPLDASPRWLLGEGIQRLHFAIDNPSLCSTFSVSNISFFQRTEVAQYAQ